jgi:hypothetical protein
MVTPVEAGTGGVALLVGNGLLKQHQMNDGHTVGEACLAALEQCAVGRGPRTRLGLGRGLAVMDGRPTPWAERMFSETD